MQLPCGTWGGSGRRVRAENSTAPNLSASMSTTPETGRWYDADDIDRLVRELDVLLNGEEGAAPQAKLCDIVAQVRALMKRAGIS